MQGSPNEKLAASLATTAVPTVPSSVTVGEVEQLLLRDVGSFKSIDYIYVVDDGRLVGVASIKDVFRQAKDTQMVRVMVREVASVHPRTHRERVAYLALKRNLKAIPVVGDGGTFLGAVLNDTILKILEQESAEDLLHVSGVQRSRTMGQRLSLFSSLRHRLPWLLVGMAGGIGAAGIVGEFHEVLERHVLLAGFVPLVMYVAGATAVQTQSFLIRDLAAEPALKFGRYLVRQAAITVCIAAVVGLAMAAVGTLLAMPQDVTAAVAISLAVAVLSSVVTGCVVPYLFARLRQDPADASGPLTTIIQDVGGVAIYFVVASLLV